MYNSLLLGKLTEKQFEHKQQLMKVLKKYLPEKAVEYCSELIILYKLHLHIEVERKDRLGDYSPHLGFGNRISINHNLNRYDFLITFIHELAHHVTHKKYGPHHQSHGAEWKHEFKNCMRPIVVMGIFPPDIEAP
jgi:SprT protein